MDLFDIVRESLVRNTVYIGDNFDVLQKLSPISVDFIYIDPPYNTNNKFSYNDSNNQWAEDIRVRLDAAAILLKPSGCICISIDDNELAELLKICHVVFGKSNYVGTCITRQAQRSNAKHINITHEYVVVFAKSKKDLGEFYIKRTDIPEDNEMITNIYTKVRQALSVSRKQAQETLKEQIEKYSYERGISWLKNYSNIDEHGRVFFSKDLSTPGRPAELHIDEIGLHLPALSTRGWSSKEKILRLYKSNRLAFKNGRPYEIQYLEEAVDNAPSVLNFYSRQGTNDLKKLGLYGYFDTPKPVELIKFLIRATTHKNAVILDFYAGSGTTGQAVYEINKEDNMEHKFILIQRKEPISKTSEVFNKLVAAGYQSPNISDILELRLNKYLSMNNMLVDFEIKEV